MKEFIKYTPSFVPKDTPKENYTEVDPGTLERQLVEKRTEDTMIQNMRDAIDLKKTEEEINEELESLQERKEALACDSYEALGDDDLTQKECAQIEDNIKKISSIKELRDKQTQVKIAIHSIEQEIKRRSDNN